MKKGIGKEEFIEFVHMVISHDLKINEPIVLPDEQLC